jgi:hypothetical protein
LQSAENATEVTAALCPIKSGWRPYYKFVRSVRMNCEWSNLASEIMQWRRFASVKLPFQKNEKISRYNK